MTPCTRKRPAEKPHAPLSILPFAKLTTCEDEDEQRELRFLHDADGHAPALITAGVLLPADGAPVRLVEAIDTLTEKRCDCRACETNYEIGRDRERAAYYVGVAVGLRLARSVDGHLVGGAL